MHKPLPLPFACSFSADHLSLVHHASGVAVDGLAFDAIVDGLSVRAAYGPSSNGPGGVLVAEGEIGGVHLRTVIAPVPGADAVVVTHALTNRTAQPRTLSAIATVLAPGGRIAMGRPDHFQLLFCHTDNVRTERCDDGIPHCQGEFPFARPLPTEPRSLGRGEDQPFPGLFVSAMGWATGLAVAATSQRLARQVFRIARAATVEPTLFATFEIQHDLVQNPEFALASGATLELDGTWFQALQRTAPQDAWTAYLAYLNTTHRFRGPTSKALTEAVYCTWNYGRFATQHDEALVATARAVARDLPGIRWYLMDAGYLEKPDGQGETTYASCGLQNFLDGDPDVHVDREKFPNGIRHYVKRIQALGLRPGIWMTPAVDPDSTLFRSHPEWLLRNRAGEVHRIGGPQGRQAYLDWTNPEVLAAARRGFAHVFREWGFEALKLDFWSHNFEDRNVALADPSATGFAARRSLFALIREFLPADGIFYTCCATGMGDPFIGEFADGYRNTIDIGAGKWHEQVDNCLWALPTVLIPGRSSLLLNNDSVGIDTSLPNNENLFRLTWCWITMGLQEIGGFIERWEPRWVEAMRRFTDRCDRGHAVRLGDERTLTGMPLPESLYVDFPEDGPTRRIGIRQSLALFNWSDEPRLVTVRRANLGHVGPVKLTDFWTGEESVCDDEFLVRRLAPRSALLLDLRW